MANLMSSDPLVLRICYTPGCGEGLFNPSVGVFGHEHNKMVAGAGAADVEQRVQIMFFLGKSLTYSGQDDYGTLQTFEVMDGSAVDLTRLRRQDIDQLWSAGDAAI